MRSMVVIILSIPVSCKNQLFFPFAGALKLSIMFCSLEVHSNEANFQANFTFRPAIERNPIFGHSKIDNSMCVSTISRLQRFPLFCQWFRSGCIWIARTNVVSACIAHKLLNRQRDVNEKYVCHLIERFPFDWKTPLGYLVAIALEYVVVSYVLLIAACLIIFGISAYLYIIALSKCIKGSLFAIGRRTQNKRNRHISDRFIEFAQFHGQVKQLSTKDSFWIRKIAE